MQRWTLSVQSAAFICDESNLRLWTLSGLITKVNMVPCFWYFRESSCEGWSRSSLVYLCISVVGVVWTALLHVWKEATVFVWVRCPTVNFHNSLHVFEFCSLFHSSLWCILKDWVIVENPHHSLAGSALCIINWFKSVISPVLMFDQISEYCWLFLRGNPPCSSESQGFRSSVIKIYIPRFSGFVHVSSAVEHCASW